jgi:hypothetical protein
VTNADLQMLFSFIQCLLYASRPLGGAEEIRRFRTLKSSDKRRLFALLYVFPAPLGAEEFFTAVKRVLFLGAL